MKRFTPEEVNQFFPVIGLVAYPGGIIVRRGNNSGLQPMNYLHKKGKLKLVTSRSLNRLALLVRASSVTFSSIMTLTYGQNYPLSGRVAKKHLNHFLIASKRNYGPFEYIWILEFQNRGAVHFHIATTLSPPAILERELFATTWQRISTNFSWLYCQLDLVGDRFYAGQTLLTDKACIDSHLSKNAWEGVRKGDSLHAYFAKYANKIRQKEVPDFYSNVGRFWGASKGVALPDGEVFWGTDRDIRELAKERGRDIDHWRVLPKVILL